MILSENEICEILEDELQEYNIQVDDKCRKYIRDMIKIPISDFLVKRIQNSFMFTEGDLGTPTVDRVKMDLFRSNTTYFIPKILESKDPEKNIKFFLNKTVEIFNLGTPCIW